MKKYIIIVLGFISLTITSSAQTASFINRPADARSMALGNTGVSSNKATAFSIFNNTAATAFSGNYLGVGLNYTNWQPSALNVNALSFGAYLKPMRNMSFALGLRYGINQTQEIIDQTGLVIGQFAPKDMILDLGVAYKILDIFSIAVNLRYINSSIYTTSGSAFAADIHYMMKMGRFSMGASINNFGTKLNYGEQSYQMPSNSKLGIAYNFIGTRRHDLILSLEFGEVFAPKNMTSVFAGGGLEYSYNSIFFLRAGYSYGDLTKYIPSHASCGVGFEFFGFVADFAYLIATVPSPIKNTLSANLSWAF